MWLQMIKKQKKECFIGEKPTQQPTQKIKKIIINSFSINYNHVFVVWGGIEPPTQGFSVLCSTD